MDCLISLIPYDEDNFTQSAWLGVLFELLENTCGIICSCMPMFAALLSRISSSGFGGTIKGLFSDIRSTGIRSSIRRLISTRSSSDPTLASRNRNASGSQKNGPFSSESYRVLVAQQDRQSTNSASDIPLENVKITKTWAVKD